MANSHSSRRLALLGVGYMGGSLALAARKAGLVDHVVGFDPDERAGPAACSLGVVDEMADSAAAAVDGADLVVLAAPVGAISTLAADLEPGLGRHALVMDLGSVKQGIAISVTRTLGGDRFAACHPMAGIESMGVAAASPDVYQGRTCLLCPVEETLPATVARARAFWQGLGCQVLSVPADRHDTVMAAISHLPHVVAFQMASLVKDATGSGPGLGEVGGPTTSLRDAVRVAASSPVMWRDIFLANRAHILPLIGGLEARLRHLSEALESGDVESVGRLLADSWVKRHQLLGD